MNIAEILKNCPQGIKLYSPVWGNVEFIKVNVLNNIEIRDSNEIKYIIYPDGKYSENGEVILFPSKDQRDWNESVIPFKYGDIVAIYNETFKGYNIGIFDEYINDRFCKLLCVTSLDNSDVNIIDRDYDIAMGWDTKNARYANHAEKIDLQVELAKVGYEWRDGLLVEIYKPKFELGDVITNGNDVVRITSITENFYGGCDLNRDAEWSIPIVREKDWILAKFNLNTLKPYDRVLVRDEGEGSIWYPTLVSYVVTNGVYTIDSDDIRYEVIPFEPNKHLIGKSLDPDKYYVTWYSED